LGQKTKASKSQKGNLLKGTEGGEIRNLGEKEDALGNVLEGTISKRTFFWGGGEKSRKGTVREKRKTPWGK